MNEHYGFSNAEWKKFSTHDILSADFTSGDFFRKVIRLMARRWKRHAHASLKQGPRRMVAREDGQNDQIDEDFLQAVEAEFPLDKMFREDFRTAMTQKLHTSDPGEAKLSEVRTQVLWDCCTRYLVKLLPGVTRLNMTMPPMPLHALRDPNNLLRSRNMVVIEDFDDDPTPVLASQQLQGGTEMSSAEHIRQASRQEQVPFLVLGDLDALDREYGGK